MKSFLGAYVAGGMSVLGIWLVYENKQKIDGMMKNIAAKADMMLQEMKSCSQNKCACNDTAQENN